MKKPPTPLRIARELRGLTLRQVRIATGIATGRLSMLERGMVTAKPAEQERLAQVLEAPLAEIFPTAATLWMTAFRDEPERSLAVTVAVAAAR
jgi:transcriptional regulator with XRE-family HTH domain